MSAVVLWLGLESGHGAAEQRTDTNLFVYGTEALVPAASEAWAGAAAAEAGCLVFSCVSTSQFTLYIYIYIAVHFKIGMTSTL